MKNFLTVVAYFAIFALVACGETVSTRFETTAAFTFDGPLFEGPESAQISIKDPLSRFLNDNNIDRSRIKKVTLIAAAVTIQYEAADVISDAGITFAGSSMDMSQVAVLNPFPKDQAKADLRVSDDAKLAPFFRADDFIVLLDLGFAEDHDDDFRASARMSFEVTFKK